MKPPKTSERAAELWDEFQNATDCAYAVKERTIRTQRWLSDDLIEYRYDLYAHVQGPEWQKIGCVNREEELLAYMYGAINASN